MRTIELAAKWMGWLTFLIGGSWWGLLFVCCRSECARVGGCGGSSTEQSLRRDRHDDGCPDIGCVHHTNYNPHADGPVPWQRQLGV